MSILIRFTINAPGIAPPSYEDIARALAAQGAGSGNEHPEFVVWGNGSYPASTVVECFGVERLVTALQRVNAAIDAAGVREFCTGGDMHLPAEPIG
jgi:hypothetical protein